MNPYASRAAGLTEWVRERLVNRTDCHGRYWLDGGKARPYTCIRGKSKSWRRLSELVPRHFAANHASQIVGLHSQDTSGMCRWCVFDIDRHTDELSESKAIGTALDVCRQLESFGVSHLPLGSNGRGGVHIWVLFDEPLPNFAIRSWAAKFVPPGNVPVEIYPKQTHIVPYGSWVRIPGRHHTRDWWAAALNPDGTYATLDATVDAILAMEGNIIALDDTAPRYRKYDPLPGGESDFEINSWLSSHGIDIHAIKTRNGGKAIELKRCPWSHQHSTSDPAGRERGEAAIFVSDCGLITYNCPHSRCDRRHTWNEFRELYDVQYATWRRENRVVGEVKLSSGGGGLSRMMQGSHG